MMPRLYTRKGDGGETGLLGGERLSKASARVEAYGHVDELNSFVGVALVEVKAGIASEAEREFASAVLVRCQDCLMRLAGELASPGRAGPRVGEGDVAAVEATIDDAQARTGELTHFLLPGVSRAEAALHQARTVCRRTERRVVALSEVEKVSPVALRFLNRLSDLLFALARVCVREQGLDERRWHGQ